MTLNRRDFLQVAAATSLVAAATPSATLAMGSQEFTQNDLLRFDAKGQVTLLHFTDCHAQLMPIYFREPSVNLGVGEVTGLPPHVSGRELLDMFGLNPGSREAYAFSSEDFVNLAAQYGRVGGMDRMATLVKAIRAERPDKTLLLDGGDTWQGSYTALQTGGHDMVKVMNKLGVEAMTAHWEFTYGAEGVKELVSALDFPFLAGNVVDTIWEEEIFEALTYFERGGVKIAVIGQAFPYTPIANPRYMMPDWSFGIRENLIQNSIDKARANGAGLVVLLSHNGFDVDRKLATRVSGIDVILTGHTHDAIPEVTKVGKTLLLASGSHGKFLSRLDLDIRDGGIADYSYRLIPILSDVVQPDPEMAQLISEVRAPYLEELDTVVGRTEGALYRRGNFNGTFDDLICDALLEGRDAEIAFSPGFRWGSSLLPGQDIRMEDVYNQTAITYPNTYRYEATGEFLKAGLEDVADNLFNVDPYFQQGGDMVRVGGLGYAIDPLKKIGERITNLTLLKTGEPIEASKGYILTGWASVNEGTDGPPVYDVVGDYLRDHKVVKAGARDNIRIKGV